MPKNNPVNDTQKILQVLSGQTVKPSPIWMMRQAGRHLPEYMKVRATTKNFIEFCFSPRKAAEVTLQPVRRYDMDAAILFADILLVPIELGRRVDFIKGQGPDLDPITPSDIAKIDLSKKPGKIQSVYETVSRVRQDLSPDKTLIGFCGGPWTVATYMIEGKGTPSKEGAKRFAYEHPKALDDLLMMIAEESADYLINQAKAGADVLKVFESWAEGLAPPLFDRLVVKPAKLIVERIRSAGVTCPIIGFPRGAGFNSLTYMEHTGITGIAAGTDTPLTRFRNLLPAGTPIQGNLDPLALRIGGDVLKQAVQNVLDDISGPHIFNLGHGVSPDVKIENVHAVIDHVRTGDGHYV